jgi:hypothetical protein
MKNNTAADEPALRTMNKSQSPIVIARQSSRCSHNNDKEKKKFVTVRAYTAIKIKT